MKILLFAASFPPPAIGGSIEYLYNIVANLPPHSVVVHTANADPLQAQKFDKTFPQRVIRSDFIHHPMEAHKRHKLRRMWQYIAWPFVSFWRIMRERPDVIHIGEANTAGIAALVANRLFGIPYMHYVYAEEITLLSTNWLRYKLFLTAVCGAQAVVTVCDYSRDLLIERGVTSERIFKVVPAVGNEKCLSVTAEQIQSVRKKYGLQQERVLLTVGALKERKGQHTVIQALSQISRSSPDVRYIVAGSGPKEDFLKKRVKELGLESKVVFTGRVDNVELACLYEICDIFVMPHRQVPGTLDTEGCPTVFLEASAHGKPVIGGNAGGVSDAILDKRTGFIIEGTNEKLLAEAISNLLSSPELGAQMGQAGREYVANLTPEKNAAKVFKISKSIAKRLRKRSA